MVLLLTLPLNLLTLACSPCVVQWPDALADRQAAGRLRGGGLGDRGGGGIGVVLVSLLANYLIGSRAASRSSPCGAARMAAGASGEWDGGSGKLPAPEGDLCQHVIHDVAERLAARRSTPASRTS